MGIEEFILMYVWLVQKCEWHFTLGAEILKNAVAFSTTVNQATAAFVPYLNIKCIPCYLFAEDRKEKSCLFKALLM